MGRFRKVYRKLKEKESDNEKSIARQYLMNLRDKEEMDSCTLGE